MVRRLKLPYLSLVSAARYLGLTPDTVFWLSKKGVFNSQRDKEGKMFFRTDEVIRVAKEEKR